MVKVLPEPVCGRGVRAGSGVRACGEPELRGEMISPPLLLSYPHTTCAGASGALSFPELGCSRCATHGPCGRTWP